MPHWNHAVVSACATKTRKPLSTSSTERVWLSNTLGQSSRARPGRAGCLSEERTLGAVVALVVGKAGAEIGLATGSMPTTGVRAVPIRDPEEEGEPQGELQKRHHREDRWILSNWIRTYFCRVATVRTLPLHGLQRSPSHQPASHIATPLPTGQHRPGSIHGGAWATTWPLQRCTY